MARPDIARRTLLGLLLALPLPALLASETLDINHASLAQLESLPGVGPTLAERMLAERARRPFADWADLRHRVAGLGDKGARRLSLQGLRVNGKAFDAAASAPSVSTSSPSASEPS